jgi:nucleoside-diphosphate-sugar epimerase
LVLLTGSSGFLGQTILRTIETPILRLGRDVASNINVDLATSAPDLSGFSSISSVIHIAGKAHEYPTTELEAQAFYDVNYKGTVNLCLALDSAGIKPTQFVFISTVAVYGLETGEEITENQELNGKTPYALSKIQAEQYLVEWGKRNDVAVLILRLPLVAGSNPPGNLGKMIKAIQKGFYFNIDGGKARKSMVLATDVAQCIVSNPKASGVFHLTDGIHPSFKELAGIICAQTKRNKSRNVPLLIAKIAGMIGDVLPFFPLNSASVSKMTMNLTFNDAQARKELNWRPKPVAQYLFNEESIKETQL